jgi:serine/threonine protein kinase
VGPADEPARYERLQEVGSGAEGAIYRARYVGRDGADETVALKQYRRPADAPDTWPSDGTWHQVRDQAWHLSRLPRNDHLVRVREVFLGTVTAFGQLSDPCPVPFVVMEWIDGKPPDAVLREQVVELEIRLAWIRDLAEAIELLHTVSRTDSDPLVHADIKPGNCLIGPKRSLVLVDTGALQRAGGLGNHRGLRTPRYAAPEVLQNPGRQRRAESDLYALGAVAFHFLTREQPPEADREDYLDVAKAALLRCTDLPEDCRADVAAHLGELLDPDPSRRGVGGAVAWARDLTNLLESAAPTELMGHTAPGARSPSAATDSPGPLGGGSRRTASVTTIAAAMVLIAGLLVAHNIGQGGTVPATPSEAAKPTPGNNADAHPTWPSIDFAGLHPFDAGGGALLYAQDLTQSSAEWAATTGPSYTTRYTSSGYELHVADKGVFQPVPTPPASSVSDEVVTATATTISGQGAWGVWCRGTDEAGSRRYEFVLSHAGAVQIVEPGDTGTGWVYVSGLNLSQPVTLSARCADVVGAPVELTLVVNGRIALTYRPTTILGPGHAGIEGMTFSDVEGPTIDAAFRRFEIRRGA